VIAASGMALLTHAYRLANANVVTVFEYSGMLWVPLWGYLLFSEVPKVSTLLGTAIIISAGIIAVKTSSESRS
jgi:drug/metabolite transporter (DMT)-like permease